MVILIEEVISRIDGIILATKTKEQEEKQKIIKHVYKGLAMDLCNLIPAGQRKEEAINSLVFSCIMALQAIHYDL